MPSKQEHPKEKEKESSRLDDGNELATFSPVISGTSDLDANNPTAILKNSIEELKKEERTVADNTEAHDFVSNPFELEVLTSPTSAFYNADDQESLPEQPSPLVVGLDSEDTKIPELPEISNGLIQFGVTTAGLNSGLNPIVNNDTTIDLRPHYVAQEPDQVESGDEGSIRIISVASHPQYFEDPLQTEAASNFAFSAAGTSKSQKQKQFPKNFTKGRKDPTKTFTGTGSLQSKSAINIRTRTSGRNRVQINYSEDFNCKNCSNQFDTAEELTEHEAMCSSSSVSSNYMTVTDDCFTVTENEVTSQSTAIFQSLSQTAASEAPVIYKIPKGVRIPAKLNPHVELRTKPAATNNSVNQDEVLDENSDDGNGGSDCFLESENNSESDSESEKKKRKRKGNKGNQHWAKQIIKKCSTRTPKLSKLMQRPFKTPIKLTQSTVSELRSIQRDNDLPFLQWLAFHQQQQAKIEERFRNVFRLDPDPTIASAEDESFSISPENPVTCKLCGTKLENEVALKNHVENCWIHNKGRHLYCTVCETSFFRASKTRESARINCRNHTLDQHPEKSDIVNSSVYNKPQDKDSDPKEIDLQDNDPQNNDLPLGQWLKNQKENRKNYICLDPEPSPTATTLSLNEPFASPIKCKLCQQLLTSDILLRNHVRMCFQNNKNKHVYCVICKTTFANRFSFQTHDRRMHRSLKNRPGHLLFCNECEKSFTTEAAFIHHKKSLQVFRKIKTTNTKLSREAFMAATQAKKYIKRAGPDAESKIEIAKTFSCLTEIVKFYRQFKTPDGSKNIILLDPEPDRNDFREISSENHITCRVCLRKLTTPKALCVHVRNCWMKNRERHRYCVPCKKTFKRPKELLEHNRVEHPEKLRAAFKCKACLQEYFDEALFEQHEEAHKDPTFLPFKCFLEDCNLSFKDERSFEKHLSNHREKIKRYRCRLCDRSFPELQDLTHHNRSHTGERPYKCQIENCGTSFRIKETLNQHNNQRHSAELGLSQDHLCSTCGKAFATLGVLNFHIKSVHVKAKVHKCPHEGCSKAFSDKQKLTEHQRDHTGKKPFQCDTCGQAFSKQWTFTKHKRSHEGTLNRAACHLCPRKFLGTWELKQHLTKVHEGAARNDDDGQSSDSD